MTSQIVKLFILAGIAYAVLISAGCKSKVAANEGFITVTGGRVWYHIEGTGNKPPILLLHGGPGSSSYGMNPLRVLATDRRVIFFDQLGCGRSDRITDTSLMTIDRFVEEVEQVRKSLDLKDFYLYGQSWGTTLGLEYYLKYPKEIKAIIFSSPCFSTSRWIKDADTLIALLPDSVRQIIRTNEKNKTFDNPQYQAAVDLYYSRYLRRRPRPQSQVDSSKLFFGKNVYEYMWGPSEFTATGSLLNYDRLNQLSGIAVPVLLIAGEYDEARPATVKYFQSLIPGAAFAEISNSGHATYNDNLGEVMDVVEKFLQKNDNGKVPGN